MMKRLIAAAPLALLFACSGNSTSMQPGQWEMTTRATNVELPGVPEQLAAQMRTAIMSQPQTQSQCITPEEAANPVGRMMSPSGDSQGCTFTDQTFSGGTIRISGTCQAPGGRGSMRNTVTGTYTATTLEARMETEVTAPPGGPPGMPQTIRMRGTMTSRRTGDCTAS